MATPAGQTRRVMPRATAPLPDVHQSGEPSKTEQNRDGAGRHVFGRALDPRVGAMIAIIAEATVHAVVLAVTWCILKGTSRKESWKL